MIETPSSGYQPNLRDLVQLDLPVEVRVAPGGRKAAIRVRRACWKDNSYETQVRVVELPSTISRWMTRSGSASQVEWLDGDSLAVLRIGNSEGDKPQVWVYTGCAGDGWQVTQHKTGVDWFYPFAGGILFKAHNPERDENKKRTDQFGSFVHFEQETSASALYYVNLEVLHQFQEKERLCTEDEAKELILPVVELSRLFPESLSIQNVVVSPSGDAVYLNCRKRDDMVYYKETSVFCLQADAPSALQTYLEREKAKKDAKEDQKETPTDPPKNEKEEAKEDLAYLGSLTRLPLPRGSYVMAVSPDGQNLVVSFASRDDKMYTQAELWSISAADCYQAADEAACRAALRRLASNLDQEIFQVSWVENGIYIVYPQNTHIHLGFINHQGMFTPISLDGMYLNFSGIHVAPSGQIGLVLENAQTLPEAYLAEPSTSPDQFKLTRLSDFGTVIKGWQLGSVETINWTSKDGTKIEGVLRKPAGFDPAQKYPLVFVVHGGPTGISTESLISYEDLFYYPAIQLVNQDVLVLKPNYRGSVGRGQAFMELNVNNLGIGDLWDLESAIDYLTSLGWIDPAKVGCMGWSQGGYISAFAGLHSQRFAAVSVGAGISDWYTYHISNDIPDFTTDYLSASPFRERSIYQKTAPISNLANAKTPTLIQHGTDDRRVPVSNATELYRGLKEVGVTVELFVYPGMGHPITRPRENHAVMAQNLTWFEHYLLGKELKLPE